MVVFHIASGPSYGSFRVFLWTLLLLHSQLKVQDSGSFENTALLSEKNSNCNHLLNVNYMPSARLMLYLHHFIYLILTTNGVILQRNYHHFIDEETKSGI